MPPKFRIIRRKKQRFKGNQFCKTKIPAVELVSSPVELAEMSQKSKSNDEDISNHHMEPSKLFLASASKLEGKYSDLESESEVETTGGIHFMNVSVLSSIFSSSWCPACKHCYGRRSAT